MSNPEEANGLSTSPNLTAEIFAFPYREKYVLYAPFVPLMILTNEATVNLLADIKDGVYRRNGDEDEEKIVAFLREKGILDGAPEKPPIAPNSQAFQPTAVTLFPTNQCNMRCIYCYASAGECRPKQMTWLMAKAAIDLVMENARKVNSQHASIGFHGGGEPTLP